MGLAGRAFAEGEWEKGENDGKGIYEARARRVVVVLLGST